ncbi:conjugal transfer protein TraO [Flavobacterium album]|nr:conjugal transfer protein TraO [Flavobacterium album]
MVRGPVGFEIGAGTFDAGSPMKNFSLNAAMVVYGSGGNYQRYGLEYAHRQYHYQDLPVPYESYILEAGYSLQLLGNPARSLALNAGLGAVAGYESYNKGKREFPDGARLHDRDGIPYGVQGTVSFEAWISDRIVLVLQGSCKALWGTSAKQLRPLSVIGIRYNLN